MNVITLSGYSATADVERLELGTFDSYGIEQLQVIKGDGWEDLNVIVTFNPPGHGKPVSVILDGTGSEITFDVPPEATQKHYGKGNIVFVGKKDGVQRISVDLDYHVKMHSNCEGESPTTPTPDVVSQILAVAENAEKTAKEAKEIAESVDEKAQTASDNAKSALDAVSALQETVDQHTDEISQIKKDMIDFAKNENVLLGHTIGSPAVCNHAINSRFRGLIVYGKGQQDGLPSFDDPVQIEVIGSDGTVNVTFGDNADESKSLAFAVSGGLWGVPVTSGGNVVYTDEKTGTQQMYVADYIDAERGKLVRRIGHKNLSDEIIDKMNGLTFRKTDGGYELGSDGNKFFGVESGALCEQFLVADNDYVYQNSDAYAISQQWVSLPSTYADKGAYLVFFHDNEITLHYILSEPVEYDLSQDETLAYRELLAYSPTTVVSASDSAMVEVTYPRDINSAISSIITAILNMGGNLDGKDDNTWPLTN